MNSLRDRVFEIANDKGYNHCLVLRACLYHYYKALYKNWFLFTNYKKLALDAVKEKINTYGYDFILSYKDILSACNAMQKEI